MQQLWRKNLLPLSQASIHRLARAHRTIVPATKIQFLRAFTGDLASGQISVRGNPCSVSVVADTPVAAPAPSGITQCFTWQVGDRAAHVVCYSRNGQEIQCCGHGLLSCANLWTSSWGGQGSLIIGSSTIACKREDNNLWIGFSTVSDINCPVPIWLEAVLKTSAVSCSEVGDEHGYLIVELQRDTDLSKISRPDNTLEKHTMRGLIVSCQVHENRSAAGEHFHFRYFAPQYGAPEDTATGSAMRVLASYWQQRGLGQELLALQCSQEGGWLRSHVAMTTTWIGGQVETMVLTMDDIDV